MRTALLLFYMYAGVLCAQERRLLKGTVMEGNILVSNPVHIINVTQKKGTITNAFGYFEIPAKVGDMITISSIQYQQKAYNVDRQLLDDDNFKIQVILAINQLDEVRLSSHGLSGSIIEDIQKIPVYTKRLDIPKTSFSKAVEKPLENLVLKDPIQATPIDFVKIYNQVEKIFAKKKNSANNTSPQISEMYSRAFFKNELQIPEEELSLFLEYLENETVVSKAKGIQDPLKMIPFIITQYKVFEAEKNTK